MRICSPRNLNLCGFLSILSLIALDTACGAPFAVPQSNLPWRTSPSDISTTPLGDGSFLISGDFSLLDDQQIGGVALLQGNGTLAPAFPGLKLAGVPIALAKRLTNGNIIAYIDRDSTSFNDYDERPIQYSFETDLGTRKVNFIYERPAAILDDGTLVFMENQGVYSYVDGILTYISILSIHYASINETGEIVHREFDQRFSQRGGAQQVLPLPDGKLLIIGGLNGEPGQLLRLLPDLTLDPSFDPSLLSTDTFELHDPKLVSTSTGEIFVFSTLRRYEPHPPPYLLRLNDNGSIDPTFSLSTPFFTTPDTQIQNTPDGYQLLNVFPASSDRCQPLIRLDRSGNVDDSFELDDSDFNSTCFAASFIALDEETTLAAVPSSSIESLNWYQISPTGDATQTNPGHLSSIPALQPTWSENQELIYETSSSVIGEETYTNWKYGITRSDGTQRLFLSVNGNKPQFTTPLGNFISRDTSTVDAQGNARGSIVAPSESTILAQSQNGLLYAQIPDPKNPAGHGRTYAITRLYPGGGIDPTFQLFPLGFRTQAMVQPYDDKLYIVSYSTDNYDLQLNRIHFDGTFDPTFQPIALEAFPTQIQPTSSGLYLASHPNYPLHVNNVNKPLGARVRADGTLDPSYRPEDYLDRGHSSPQENRTITEDGHVYLFAERRGSIYDERGQLWHIPPSGDPARIEPETYWRSPYIDVSSQGSLFISGVQITSDGSERTSRIYHTRPTAYSYPNDVFLVTEAENINIPVTFPNSDSLSFQWFQNGTSIPGATSELLSISSSKISEPTEFTLNATDSTGDTQEIGPFYVLNESTKVPSPVLRESPSGLDLSFPIRAPQITQLLRSTDLENWQLINTFTPTSSMSQQMPASLQPTKEHTFWKFRILKLD